MLRVYKQIQNVKKKNPWNLNILGGKYGLYNNLGSLINFMFLKKHFSIILLNKSFVMFSSHKFHGLFKFFANIFFFHFSTFCMVDENEKCFAVNVYNMVQGKGVIIGDSVCIFQPFVQHFDFSYREKVNIFLNNKFV